MYYLRSKVASHWKMADLCSLLFFFVHEEELWKFRKVAIVRASMKRTNGILITIFFSFRIFFFLFSRARSYHAVIVNSHNVSRFSLATSFSVLVSSMGEMRHEIYFSSIHFQFSSFMCAYTYEIVKGEERENKNERCDFWMFRRNFFFFSLSILKFLFCFFFFHRHRLLGNWLKEKMTVKWKKVREQNNI